ncbi:hypothetical protein CKM354_001005400 [Cercospora kikuchii]|uniref:GH16 domain-containing protein n=1 Tax=Cercospora kikuchii TaxID=84275 RepID=A0A9P3FJI3_9PEZI|nr:uncharacterized protein CKM354_001005400 [Cercospora kikuchii]GIZ46952.1 hypothetical protein CKM354_001005400 [Cercospora kikuchii]
MRSPAQTLLLLFFPLLLVLLLSRTTTATNCPCGYTTPNGAFFTDALETDFFHVGDLARDTNSAWIPQAYNVTPGNANGPFGKASRVENVVANPMRGGRDVWDGEGIDGEDPGLGSWTRSTLISSSSDEDDDEDEDEGGGGGSMIPMSEIVSSRTDILYGSFRIALKATNINGTCGAFFFYFNDSTEIDMEFLSRQTVPTTSNNNSSINLVIQSPDSARKGYASGPDFILKSLSFDPTIGYNEFRFDWFPSHVDFFANSVLLHRMEGNVPKGQPGALHVSHWSNGNEGWSGGPPERDAVLRVGYVKGYFNVSGSEGEGWRGRCEAAREGEREVCKVEDQVVPPDPGVGNGETVFLTEQGGSQSGDGDEGTKTGGAEKSTFPEAWWIAFVLSVVVLLFDIAV